MVVSLECGALVFGVVMLLHTPLHAAHLKMAARMVDFGGWEMPLHYGSQIAEHHSVRRHCAMFDVSHMTIVDVLGEQAKPYLGYLLANDVGKLTVKRQALYSVMLNHDGGVIDDLMVYVIDEGFRVVVNCATRVKDLAWMRARATGFDVVINERADLAMIAVQGPEAVARVQTAVATEAVRAIADLPRFSAIMLGTHHYARTGYTGEDGVEVMLPAQDAVALWWRLHEVGVAPAGLGARDTLRLEAGLDLYGHEMDEQTSPLAANLGWTIAWHPATRHFVGRDAITAQREQGVTDKLVSVLMTARGVLRTEQKVYFADTGQTGVITSGGFSPTLGYAIGLARVPKAAGAVAEVEIRGQRKAVRLLTPGLVRNGVPIFDESSV